ncbi:MAG TPA: copper resistance protein [Nitrospiraceae bacterium]|nr:copper resistance protein [Nitrospiraceae bacterium]
MPSLKVKKTVWSFFLFFWIALPGVSHGHAFPDHSDPRVGATVSGSPSTVRIWFDGDIEPIFSTISVQDASGKRVDKGNGHVDPPDSTLLEVSVPPLPPGTYRVIWSVVARDGHRTMGDYTFVVK